MGTSNLIKPTVEGMADPKSAMLIVLRLFEAVQALQASQGGSTPENVADAAGKSSVVVLRGATVTLPGSTTTFTADLYVTGVKL